MKKRKYKSLTAEELSKNTGVPLVRVKEIMEMSFTSEDISIMAGIPHDEIKRRAKEEGWPHKKVNKVN